MATAIDTATSSVSGNKVGHHQEGRMPSRGVVEEQQLVAAVPGVAIRDLDPSPERIAENLLRGATQSSAGTGAG